MRHWLMKLFGFRTKMVVTTDTGEQRTATVVGWTPEQETVVEWYDGDKKYVSIVGPKKPTVTTKTHDPLGEVVLLPLLRGRAKLTSL